MRWIKAIQNGSLILLNLNHVVSFQVRVDGQVSAALDVINEYGFNDAVIIPNTTLDQLGNELLQD